MSGELGRHFPVGVTDFSLPQESKTVSVAQGASNSMGTGGWFPYR